MYMGACQAIARSLAGDSFRYSKSAQSCSRRSGPFIQRLRFQSSVHNAKGFRVRLCMHATIHSRELAEWRRRELSEPFANDFVAGGMVHLLTRDRAYIEWELADPADRQETVADAITFVRGEVFPFFAAFETPQHLLRCLCGDALDCPQLEMTYTHAVEFAQCFGGLGTAQRVSDTYLANLPRVVGALARSKAPASLREAGDWAQAAVFFAQRFGLSLPPSS